MRAFVVRDARRARCKHGQARRRSGAAARQGICGIVRALSMIVDTVPPAAEVGRARDALRPAAVSGHSGQMMSYHL